MTTLQLALTSNEEMDDYLENNTSQEIRQNISAYSNADRTVIATAAMQAILSHQEDNIGINTVLDVLGLPRNTEYSYTKHYMAYIAIISTSAADALIAALNKKP